MPKIAKKKKRSARRLVAPGQLQRSLRLKKRRQEKFITAYLQLGTIHHACLDIGLTRQAHYEWLEDEGYALLFAQAQEAYKERLEREADRRAVQGVDHPVIYQGEITDTYKEYSDNLLMFRLKKLDPDGYRDRQEIRHEGRIAHTVIVKTIDPHGVRGRKAIEDARTVESEDEG